uniref:Uncharacterized protein n=1 Tax=Onchocerca volvulus TaxID=6282 RepID=A0A8R1TNH6_ONCVO
MKLDAGQDESSILETFDAIKFMPSQEIYILDGDLSMQAKYSSNDKPYRSQKLHCVTSVEIYKYKPAGVNAIHVGKLRRKRLLSFVICSYANEIVILPRFFASLALVICTCIRCQIKGTTFYDNMTTIIRIFYESNSIGIGLSTLLPLNHIVMQFFQCFENKTNHRLQRFSQ